MAPVPLVARKLLDATAVAWGLDQSDRDTIEKQILDHPTDDYWKQLILAAADLHGLFDGDDQVTREWLNQPVRSLEGCSPLEALLHSIPTFCAHVSEWATANPCT